MQDRYAGDVGDFGKFGLLRHLFGGEQWKLGVIWYAFPDEAGTDGRHTDYLTKAGFKNCDEVLHSKLKIIVESDSRSITTLQNTDLLQDGTIYFSDSVDFYDILPGNSEKNKEARIIYRRNWLKRAQQMVSGCNAIFLDPDNGLEPISSCKLSCKKAGKYAYYDEIVQLYESKKICVIYHHFYRDTHEKQIKDKICLLRQKVNPSGLIFALRFKAYSPRAYFILTVPEDENYVKEKLIQLTRKPWKRCWDELFMEEQ